MGTVGEKKANGIVRDGKTWGEGVKMRKKKELMTQSCSFPQAALHLKY